MSFVAGGTGSNIVILPKAEGQIDFLFAVMMSVLHVISAICPTLFPPSAGNKYKNHPSRYGSIALPVPEVPKMSVGAICFTSSGSNGGCGVVLVFPLFFFKEKWGFFSHTRFTPKKKFTRLPPKKKKNSVEIIISALRLFPQSSYAFLQGNPPRRVLENFSCAPKG